MEQATLYTAERGTGAHAHLITDIYLKDASGKVARVARKQGMMHYNYKIVDGNEATTGYIETKRHLTSSTVQVEDSGHAVRALVQIGYMKRHMKFGGGFPSQKNAICTVEDPSGVQMGSVNFQEGLLSFSMVRPDGSTVFDTSIVSGQGLRQTLSALTHEYFSVRLYDQGFPINNLLAIIAAVDQAMES